MSRRFTQTCQMSWPIASNLGDGGDVPVRAIDEERSCSRAAKVKITQPDGTSFFYCLTHSVDVISFAKSKGVDLKVESLPSRKRAAEIGCLRCGAPTKAQCVCMDVILENVEHVAKPLGMTPAEANRNKGRHQYTHLRHSDDNESFVCGSTDAGAGTLLPDEVNCPACVKTEAFKDAERREKHRDAEGGW